MLSDKVLKSHVQTQRIASDVVNSHQINELWYYGQVQVEGNPSGQDGHGDPRTARDAAGESF